MLDRFKFFCDLISCGLSNAEINAIIDSRELCIDQVEWVAMFRRALELNKED